MPSVPALQGVFLSCAAIFLCMGVGLLFLRKAADTMAGPSWWAASFFFNSIGFLCWAEVTEERLWIFALGDFYQMSGFIALVAGIHRFTGQPFRRWHGWAGLGLFLAWAGVMQLLELEFPGSFLLYNCLSGLLFMWAGVQVLRHGSDRSPTARRLAWALLAWAGYGLLLPVVSARLMSWFPFAFGLLVGFEVLVAIGLVVLVLERLRERAEFSERQVQQLESILPICSHCKKIRDEEDQWHQIEHYIAEHSDTAFSHGVCPDCARKYYAEFIPPQKEA